MDTQVECHSGYSYADEPRALFWEGRRLKIVEILSRWRSPRALRFHVRTEDDQAFDLRYDESNDSWRVKKL